MPVGFYTGTKFEKSEMTKIVLNEINLIFPFKFKQNRQSSIERFNVLEEFLRQEIDPEKHSHIVRIYKNEICTSYPEVTIIPVGISDMELKEASEYRTKNRFPTLTWSSRTNAATLWRSSQTKAGLLNFSNEADTKLLNEISELSMRLVIFDARPYSAAFANKVAGKGYEEASSYDNCEIVFLDIPNIHAVSSSLEKLINLCNRKM